MTAGAAEPPSPGETEAGCGVDAMMMGMMSKGMMPMAGMESMDMAVMQACMDACSACEQACTVCAGQGMEDGTMMSCATMCMNCADMCNTMMRAMMRPMGMDTASMRAMLDACIAMCRACADECMTHAEMSEVCRMSAQACRACMDACMAVKDAMAAMA